MRVAADGFCFAKASSTRVTVVPTAPVIISTDMFGLTDELGELRALALDLGARGFAVKPQAGA